MIGLLQRVSAAEVAVAGKSVARIGRGILVLVGIERDDNRQTADRLAERLLGYRVFADAEGKMNLSVGDIAGGVLLVPQYTLVADTRKGMRASFTPAANPEYGHTLFDFLAARLRAQHPQVETGIFGADMKVTLTNDGPVTFILRACPRASASTEPGNSGRGF